MRAQGEAPQRLQPCSFFFAFPIATLDNRTTKVVTEFLLREREPHESLRKTAKCNRPKRVRDRTRKSMLRQLLRITSDSRAARIRDISSSSTRKYARFFGTGTATTSLLRLESTHAKQQRWMVKQLPQATVRGRSCVRVQTTNSGEGVLRSSFSRVRSAM